MIHHAQRFRRGTGVFPVDNASRSRSTGETPCHSWRSSSAAGPDGGSHETQS
jgi:hypothetical protein